MDRHRAGTNWGFGDSEMASYARAASQVVVVRTLADLERVAAQLVPALEKRRRDMDVKTLRLASIQLTEPLLAQYLAYERALIAELDRTDGHSDWSGRFAFAHQHALHEAKLDVLTYGKIRALVGDWCSRQRTLEAVRQRLDEARASATEAVTARRLVDPKDQRLIERAERELPELEQLGRARGSLREGRRRPLGAARRGECSQATVRSPIGEGCHMLELRLGH